MSDFGIEEKDPKPSLTTDSQSALFSSHRDSHDNLRAKPI